MYFTRISVRLSKLQMILFNPQTFCGLVIFLGSLSFVNPGLVSAQSVYFNRIFFDNSLTPDRYYHSRGRAVGPSRLRLIAGKLPGETEIFLTPPNALHLQW